jgi:CelD/BcsL family acetyltransferase involved in cellulose biosynthesis
VNTGPHFPAAAPPIPRRAHVRLDYNPRALAVDIICSPEVLAAFVPQWDALWRRSSDATPFQSPLWLMPWWHHYGTGGELNVVVERDAGEVKSVAPLYVLRDDDESLGLLLGTGISDYLDVLGDGAAVLDTMRQIDCQMWDLQQLRPTSPLLNLPLPDGLSDNLEDQEPCPVLSIVGAGRELENLISPHGRKKIRYYRRVLAREGEVRVEAANDANLDELLVALYELHAARWQRRDLPGVLGDPTVQQFHREVARAMLAAGALRMYATRLRDRIVAVFYGFAHAGTVYYYLSGYDPELEKLSIGTLVVAHAIEAAVRDGVTAFDFLRGAEEYKYVWGAKDRMNRRRQVFKS